MKIINCEQNTPEWDEARRGKPTASQFKLIVTTKGERSKSRDKYLHKIAGEMVGNVSESYYNDNMKQGHEREQESKDYYSFNTGNIIETVGFCLDDSGKFGCSPDGLIGDKGGFETKNACSEVHLPRLIKGWEAKEHFQQVQGCLLVTGREWWDVVSYCRGFENVVFRMERDEVFLKKLRIELKLFHNDLITIINKYSLKKGM